MANDITNKTKDRIAEILSNQAYDDAKKNEKKQPPVNYSVCALCKCPGGNGMLQRGSAFAPCPACTQPVS